MRTLALAATLLLSACAARPTTVALPATPPPQDRPPDFVLAVTVTAPPAPGAPRSLRPARYIIEADGALRAATGPGSTETTFPPVTRQLTPKQQDQLWLLVRDSGLLDPNHPARVRDPAMIPRDSTRPTALLWIAFAEDAATLRLPLDRTSENALEAESLIDRLAAWSWVR